MSEGNGHARGEPTLAEMSAAEKQADRLNQEIAVQLGAMVVRHQAQCQIPADQVKARIQLCQTNWPKLEAGQDGIVQRTWCSVDGREYPFLCVQVRLTGLHVYVETVMVAGLRA